MHRGPFSPARLQTLTYHLCVELLPPLVYYIWQDVGLHFAFVAYFIHNAIIRIWTPIPSLQFMFTKFVHNFLTIPLSDSRRYMATSMSTSFDCKTLLVLLAPSRMSFERVAINIVFRFSILFLCPSSASC